MIVGDIVTDAPRIVAEAVAALGALHVVVNNAGRDPAQPAPARDRARDLGRAARDQPHRALPRSCTRRSRTCSPRRRPLDRQRRLDARAQARPGHRRLRGGQGRDRLADARRSRSSTGRTASAPTRSCPPWSRRRSPTPTGRTSRSARTRWRRPIRPGAWGSREDVAAGDRVARLAARRLDQWHDPRRRRWFQRDLSSGPSGPRKRAHEFPVANPSVLREDSPMADIALTVNEDGSALLDFSGGARSASRSRSTTSPTARPRSSRSSCTSTSTAGSRGSR